MPTADLTISMDDGTTTVAPGAATSYTIVVSNNGPDAVTGATVFDSLPDGITGNSWLATGSTGGGSVTGPAIGSGPLATTVDLPVGGAVVFTFTVLVNPSLTTGSLINLAVVLAPAGTTDPNDPGNNHAIDTDTLTPQADLSVTMTDGKAIVVPGTSDTYTITVTNNGPSTVSSLTLSDTIPAALLNRNFAPSVGAYDAATGAWSGLSLASGQHVTLTLTGTIASNATGTITNTVTVAPPAGTTDTDPFNGTATDTDTLPPKLTTAASPDVTLSGSVVTLRDSATLSDGSNPTGTITFTLIAPGGLTVDTETVAVNGDGTYTTPTGFTLPTAGTVAGTYSWNATYSGDPNNNPANASPEPTVVSRASPGLSTTASPGGVAGTTLTDIAHLSGGYFPSGTITFMLTATSGLTVDTETVTANGNGTYATPTGFTLPTGTVPGTYVWHVLYNGDGNNNTVAANLENVTVGVNPFPPPGTTADMILRASNTSLIAGQYEIYDIGNNAILAASVLGQVGTDFQFAGLGSFFGSDTTDMLLRSATTGAFEVYDISNNNITNAAALGTVGLNFQVAGFGDFNRDGATDMVLRSSTTGQFELYNIRNNAITSASNLGTVGLNFQVAGFGNFNGDGSTDMMLRNVNTGQFELYDIVNNQITSAFNIGTVGLDFQGRGLRRLQRRRLDRHDAAQQKHGPIRALRHRQQSDHVGLQHRHGRVGFSGRRLRGVSRTRRLRHDIAQREYGPIRGLRHRQQSDHNGQQLGRGRLEFPSWRLRRQSCDRIDGWRGLNRAARASDGGFWRRRRCGRRIEHCPARRRRIPDVSDATARVRILRSTRSPRRRRRRVCPTRRSPPSVSFLLRRWPCASERPRSAGRKSKLMAANNKTAPPQFNRIAPRCMAGADCRYRRLYENARR